MSRSDTARMQQAIKTGRHWASENTAVAPAGRKPSGRRELELRVQGLLVATIGDHMFINLRGRNASLLVSRINAALAVCFPGGTHKLYTAADGTPYVVHPKINALTGKWGVGHTYLPINAWWEVPGTPKYPQIIPEKT